MRSVKVAEARARTSKRPAGCLNFVLKFRRNLVSYYSLPYQSTAWNECCRRRNWTHIYA
jgi:hypothetical protein